MKFSVLGRPATKKNHSRIVRRGQYPIVLPSKAYEAYERIAIPQIRSHVRKTIRGPIVVCCHYWLPDRRWWPDLVGLLQATSDLLESAGAIENDKNIVSYGDSKICGLDKKNPRVEIEIVEGETVQCLFELIEEVSK